jgi:hypothetical protein
LLDPLRLWVKDLDLEPSEIAVHEGERNADRATMINK